MIGFWVLAAAAAPPNVGEIWLDATAEARVSDPISVGVTQNHRFSTGGQGVHEVLTDAGVQARLNDTFRLGTAYRFGTKADDGAWPYSHRWVVDAKARFEHQDLRIDWRERYQIRLPAADKGPRHRIRSRVRASLDIKGPITPRIAAEPFLLLGDGDGEGDGIGLSKIRFDAGFRYRNKPFDVDVLYRMEEPIRDRTDNRLHVINVGFTWNIDLRQDEDDDE